MTQRFTIWALALSVITSLTFAAQPLAASAQELPHARPGVPTTESKVTGCLRTAGGSEAAGTQAVVYTLDTAATASGSAPNSPAGPPAGSPGTLRQTAQAKKGPSYTLKAPESIGLAKHVNHTVELTGRLQHPPAATGRASSQPAPEPSGAADAAAQVLEVTALRMVSATCS